MSRQRRGRDWPGTNAAWYTVGPLQVTCAAVTRATLDGRPEGGWFPEERIDVDRALRAYQGNNAWVGMMENDLGKMKEGFLADLAALEESPLDVDRAGSRTSRCGRRS